GITINSVNYFPSTAMNTIRVEDTGAHLMYTDLEQALETSTAQNSGLGALDVVLLRSITNGTGGNSGILGIAGGIPGSPVMGTPHTGATASLQAKCNLGNNTFGSILAHEL